SGEIRFPMLANTHQRLMGVTASRLGHRRTVEVRASTYSFDKDGRLDLLDQANAAQDIAGASHRQGNVVDARNLLAGRRWQSEHDWVPPQDAIRQVEADMLPEKRTSEFKPAPILR